MKDGIFDNRSEAKPLCYITLQSALPIPRVQRLQRVIRHINSVHDKRGSCGALHLLHLKAEQLASYQIYGLFLNDLKRIGYHFGGWLLKPSMLNVEGSKRRRLMSSYINYCRKSRLVCFSFLSFFFWKSGRQKKCSK